MSVTVTNLPTAGRAVTISRHGLDADTSNTHTLWLQEGAPQDPTDAQLARIRVGEELAELEPARKEAHCPAELSFTFRLPMPGAVLIEISPS